MKLLAVKPSGERIELTVEELAVSTDDGEPVIIIGSKGPAIYQLLRGDKEFSRYAGLMGLAADNRPVNEIKI